MFDFNWIKSIKKIIVWRRIWAVSSFLSVWPGSLSCWGSSISKANCPVIVGWLRSESSLSSLCRVALHLNSFAILVRLFCSSRRVVSFMRLVLMCIFIRIGTFIKTMGWRSYRMLRVIRLSIYQIFWEMCTMNRVKDLVQNWPKVPQKRMFRLRIPYQTEQAWWRQSR